jgi:hypothetical protein
MYQVQLKKANNILKILKRSHFILMVIISKFLQGKMELIIMLIQILIGFYI